MSSIDLGILWEKRFSEYEASGQSIVSWCKEHSIKINQFYYWRRRLRLDRVEKRQPVKWLSIDLDPSKQKSHDTDSISIHVGQATIELKKGFDQQLLREIIQVLHSI